MTIYDFLWTRRMILNRLKLDLITLLVNISYQVG